MFNKVAIVGVGLIGGSLGMALLGRNLAAQVIGIDTDTEILVEAKETNAITSWTTDIAQGISDADLVIIAVPVSLTVKVIKDIMPYLKKGAILTDVGSTKEAIVNAIEEFLPQSVHFVGGHPMAGSERAGIAGADRYLFENAVYILTPTDKTDRQAMAKVVKMVEGIGAKLVYYSPGEHDLMVAAISHLPHLVAASLVNTVSSLDEAGEKALMLAGGGFRDTTRVSSGQPAMWRDICLANKDKILHMLKKLNICLQEAEKYLLEGDCSSVEDYLWRAKKTRDNIPAKMKGYLPSLFEIVVTVPDKPGVIAELSTALGDEGINITDIEILRVREGEGGTIRVGFALEEEQTKALAVLRGRGINAKKR